MNSNIVALKSDEPENEAETARAAQQAEDEATLRALREAVGDRRIKDLELDAADLRFKNGRFFVKTAELTAPDPNKPKAKSSKERQREFNERKKAEGFRKDWLHESVDRMAREAGGQEYIEAFMNGQRQQLDEMRRKLQQTQDSLERAEKEAEHYKARAEATQAAEQRARDAESRAQSADARSARLERQLAARRWWKIWRR